MAKVTKAQIDKELRERMFETLFSDPLLAKLFTKINDRQYGVIVEDMNGEKRYIRIGAIVAEVREDMTAEELMQSEIDAYNQKQADKEEKAKAVKIAKDKAKREAEKAKKEAEAKENNA